MMALRQLRLFAYDKRFKSTVPPSSTKPFARCNMVHPYTLPVLIVACSAKLTAIVCSIITLNIKKKRSQTPMLARRPCGTHPPPPSTRVLGGGLGDRILKIMDVLNKKHGIFIIHCLRQKMILCYEYLG